MNRKTRDERLRRLLREADPAAGQPGLSQDEIHEMRRTVLTALPERRWRLFPALALSGAVAAALILIAVLLPRPVSEPAPPPPRIAAAPVRPAPPRTVQPAPQEEPKPRAQIKRTAVHRKRKAPAPRPTPPPAMPEAADMLASAELRAEPQQIQFSTPGGTRIIWMLSPGKVSE